MTSRNVETRIASLEARSRIGRFDRLSRAEIVAEAGSRYRRLVAHKGGHAAVIAAVAQINQGAAQRLDALHQAGELVA